MIKSLLLLTITLLAAGLAEAKPLLIFNGGFGSCAIAGSTWELKASAQMDAMVTAASEASGADALQIRTCYAFGADTIYVTAPHLGFDSEPMTRADFHNVVRESVRSAGNLGGVHVWGQSHGGWTAMDLVRRVPEINYSTLMTVDPISVVECGPVVFTGGVITGSAPGCQRAPADLASSFAKIARSINHWVNWYQREFSLLHSDKISEAHDNIERFLNAAWWIPMGSHRLTETDDVMWQDAISRVERQIKSDAR